MTIEVDPSRQMAHPILPNRFSRSLKSFEDRIALKISYGGRTNSRGTYVTNTERAPKGVTKEAGAKA